MTYNFHDPVIQRIGEFDLVYFDGCGCSGQEGKAMVPFYPVKLLLPQGEVAQSIEIQYQDECVLPGIIIFFPQQRLRPVSDGNSGEFIIDAGFYDRGIEYPESRQAEVNTHFMNGYGIAISSFTPVKYIAFKTPGQLLSENNRDYPDIP